VWSWPTRISEITGRCSRPAGFSWSAAALFPAWYFQGLEKLKEAALIQAVAKCVITGCTFLLVKSSNDIVLAAFLMSSPQFIGVLVALALAYPLEPPKPLSAQRCQRARRVEGQLRYVFIDGVEQSLSLLQHLHSRTHGGRPSRGALQPG
jgi:hypothetical protein